MVSLYACFAGLLTLLSLAALTDLRERRIPNWLTGGAAALYPVYLLLSPVPVAWASALALSLLVALVGLALFTRRLIGGGDVKLIAAVTLWAGLDHFAAFALVTALTG
ncbi:MAG: putative pilus assembly protein CpaA, partial [Geminicoccaceae bacterium]|nr:putative pilus assembly protein CpaA [Geminicoccaceae bacterium]